MCWVCFINFYYFIIYYFIIILFLISLSFVYHTLPQGPVSSKSSSLSFNKPGLVAVPFWKLAFKIVSVGMLCIATGVCFRIKEKTSAVQLDPDMDH